MNKIKEYTEKVFVDIKHIAEFGNEYWLVRNLMLLFEHIKWEKISG